MPYKNPIPRVDAAKDFIIKVTFKFEIEMTEDEAVKGISEVVAKAIADNNGELPLSWIAIKDSSR